MANQTTQTQQADYAIWLAAEIEKVEIHWRLLQQRWNSDTAQSMVVRLQTMAEEAASFGFSAFTDTAQGLALYVREFNQRSTPPTHTERAELKDRLKTLKKAADRPDTPVIPAKDAQESAADEDSDIPVYLAEDDEMLSGLMVSRFKARGYRLQVFNKLADLPSAVSKKPPAALIVNITLKQDGLSAPQMVADIRKQTALPVIFISERDDMTARLVAVRAKGDAYLTKPLSIEKLLDKLEELTLERAGGAYRILFIDDTGGRAGEYAKMLQHEGMRAYVLNNPMQMMLTLRKTRPKLVLINTRLSGINSLALAMLLRQRSAHVPVMFYGSPSDQALRDAAIRGTADGFFTEPVSATELAACTISCIKNAERLNQARELSNRDPLSGLYNRRYLFALLESFRLEELQHPLSALFIHLHSKHEIPDLAANDALIQETARLLRTHTAPDDILARLSDNAFVILCSTRPFAEIEALADSIRPLLRKLKVSSETMRNTCSIGIGVALSTAAHPQQVVWDAESACIRARRMGGNLVQLHDSVHADKRERTDRKHWKQEIRKALENDTFYLAYQPIITLQGESHEYYDVLLRMEGGPDGRGITPAKFMPIAEQSKLIVQIDRWVINRVIKYLTEKYGFGQDIHFFVRVSGASLCDVSLLHWLESALTAPSFPAEALIFDLSQTAVTKHLKNAQGFISAIKKLGCRFVLGDFDDNINSWSLLGRIEVDFVKLSAPLVQGLAHHPEDVARIQNIVTQARASGKSSIAPFVEDAESLSLLWSCEIDHIAGNFLQAPEKHLDYDFSGH
ncbi:MAG: EAL domain-containing protein [Gammaproteobacteria bacterium]|nr:EAL domain-containing protein [Gammaproteobacteria bacterium]